MLSKFLFFFPLYTPGPSFRELDVENAFYYAISQPNLLKFPRCRSSCFERLDDTYVLFNYFCFTDWLLRSQVLLNALLLWPDTWLLLPLSLSRALRFCNQMFTSGAHTNVFFPIAAIHLFTAFSNRDAWLFRKYSSPSVHCRSTLCRSQLLHQNRQIEWEHLTFLRHINFEVHVETRCKKAYANDDDCFYYLKQ